MKTKALSRRFTHLPFLSTPLFVLLLFAIVFAAAAPVRGADLFMKLSGVIPTPGESRDPQFKGGDGWNEIFSFDWKVTATSSWTMGGGASVGKPAPQACVITKKIDSASAGILAAITTGKNFANAEVVVRGTLQATSTDPVDVVLRYEFTGLYFTSVAPAAASGNPEAMESVSCVFKTVKMTYRPLGKDGALGTPIVVSWDIPAGSVTGP